MQHKQTHDGAWRPTLSRTETSLTHLPHMQPMAKLQAAKMQAGITTKQSQPTLSKFGQHDASPAKRALTQPASWQAQPPCGEWRVGHDSNVHSPRSPAHHGHAPGGKYIDNSSSQYTFKGAFKGTVSYSISGLCLPLPGCCCCCFHFCCCACSSCCSSSCRYGSCCRSAASTTNTSIRVGLELALTELIKPVADQPAVLLHWLGITRWRQHLHMHLLAGSPRRWQWLWHRLWHKRWGRWKLLGGLGWGCRMGWGWGLGLG